ncbi:MAG TPA: hypothetical protein PKD98_28810 [Anaerolineae bacterium]|nr:hypothetical protein [Anaerolineae bacterium]
MLSKTHNRIIFGAFIGAFGGSSFILSIFPIAMGLLFDQLSGNALIETLYYTLHIALLWGIGGAITGWLGKMRDGAAIMGLCGIIAGVIVSLALLAQPDTGTILVLAGALVGLAYGIPAGLLVGGALRRPVE